jgi:hypothetical protein
MATQQLTNKDLMGAFIFTLQDHGTLYGLYNNTVEQTPFPETAKREKVGNSGNAATIETDPFLGTYRSTWLESRKVEKATLQIDKGIVDDTYHLFWKDKKVEYFRGLAFKRGNELVGVYWKE